MHRKAVSMSAVERVPPSEGWSWLAESLRDFWCSTWSGCWNHRCLNFGGILWAIHYDMCSFPHVLYFKKAYLPLPKSSFIFLLFNNKCSTNIYRIVVLSGARIIACFKGCICCGSIQASDVQLHLVQLISLHYDLAFVFRVKASLAFFFLIRSSSCLHTKGSSSTIAVS